MKPHVYEALHFLGGRQRGPLLDVEAHGDEGVPAWVRGKHKRRPPSEHASELI